MVPEITGAISSEDVRHSGGMGTDRESCLVCNADLIGSEFFSRNRICPVCKFHYSLNARERIDSLADPGSFRETNSRISSLDPLSFSSRTSYRQRIANDQRRTGLTEALVTGTCLIGGSPAILAVLDFGFMGGSMGSVVGEKVALAMENAAKRKMPVVVVVTSGGARVQEGILSLMQMAKTVMATSSLEAKGLPLISVLANPATGQAYASFANLADIILAEPGAIVGLAPMTSIRDSSAKPLPYGAHTSDSHLSHGMVDDVVHRTELRDRIAILLDLLGPRYRLKAQKKAVVKNYPEPRATAWDVVNLARHPDRPTSGDYINRIVSSFVELHGDRVYGDDKSIICGFGHLGGQTVAIIGQERGSEDEGSGRHGGRTYPEGFRKAKRIAELAEKFDLPLITLIDTPGPHLSLDAEERGLGNTIATMMAVMGRLTVPSIAVIIGEGGSEGALALALTNRVLMLENAIYSVISPEEAADLIYQDQGKAEQVAESLRLTAKDCWELGIVDRVVQESRDGAHSSPGESARQLRGALMQEISALQPWTKRRVQSGRRKKFRKMGEYSSHFRNAVKREVSLLQGLVATRVRRLANRKTNISPETLGDSKKE